MSSNTLTADELQERTKKIAEPTFNLMKKLIHHELKIINEKHKTLTMNSLLNLIMVSLSSVDANILVMFRDLIKKSGAKDFEFEKILEIYFESIRHFLTQEGLMNLKEKIN